MSEPTQTQTLREGGESVPPERTLEELRSTTELIKRELSELKQKLSELKVDKIVEYIEKIRNMTEYLERIYKCLDGNCNCEIQEWSTEYVIRMKGPVVFSVEVPKTVSITEAFDMIRNKIRAQYHEILKYVTYVINDMLKYGIDKEMEFARVSIESLGRQLDRSLKNIESVEERIEELEEEMREEVEEDG